MKIKLSVCIILITSLFFIEESSAKEKSSALEKSFINAEAAVKQDIIVHVELPSFGRKQLNPYFALWLSKKNNQHKALVVIREKVKWLRDLKRFWRSIARESRSESDAVTGATSKNKTFDYTFTVNGTWDEISLEVAREHGKKELITLPISLTKSCVNGELEIEKFCIERGNNN